MKIFSKISIILILVTSVIAPNIRQTQAATYTTGSTVHQDWYLADPNSGRRDSHEAELRVNDTQVFCIDAFTKFKSGQSMNLVDWSTVNIPVSMAKELSLISYFGTKVEGRTGKDWYAITQGLIWKVLHESEGHTNMCYVETPTNPNYATTVKLWNQILDDVQQYKKSPSFANQTYTVDSDSTLKITDTNNVLKGMVIKNSGGLDVGIQDNQLIIHGKAQASDEITLTLQKYIPEDEVGPGLVFYNGVAQSLAQFKVIEPLEVQLKIKINKFGRFELTKYNEDNSLVIPQTSFRITGPQGYNQVIKTNDQGKIVLERLPVGEYKAIEVEAAKGYVIDVSEHKFTIHNAETTPLKLINHAQLGEVTISKIGEVLNDYKDGEFIYKAKGLLGAKIEIRAKDDIYDPTRQTLLYKKGEVVETLVTKEDGKITSSKLPLGQYEYQEIEAPQGYILNNEIKTFALEYQDQHLNLVHQNIDIKNQRQKVEIEVSKKDEDTKEYLDGAKIALIANRDIYNDEHKVIVKAGTILQTISSSKEGKKTFEIDLPIDIQKEMSQLPIEDETMIIGNVNSLFMIKEIEPPFGYQAKNIHYYIDTTYQKPEEKVISFTYDFLNKEIPVVTLGDEPPVQTEDHTVLLTYLLMGVGAFIILRVLLRNKE